MAFEDRYNRAQYPFNLGQTVVFNLNNGLNILQGHVIIEGTFTISGVGAAGVPIGEGGALNLVKEIRVIGNKAAGSRYPNGTLVKCTPQDLCRFACTERQGKYVGEFTGNGAMGAGVNGAYTIYLDIPIYFADSTNLNNVQTALNMNGADSTGAPIYSAVQVQVDLAAGVTDLFSGNNGALAANGMVQWKDDRLGLTADTTPLIQEGHYAYIQNANTEFVDAAMPNSGLFTQWLVLAQQGSPGWQLSNALINKLRMQGSGLNYFEYANDIQMEMLNTGWYDPSQSLTGQYAFDWTHGLLANSNDAAGLVHQFDLNNPSGSGLDRLRIYTRRIIPLPAATK